MRGRSEKWLGWQAFRHDWIQALSSQDIAWLFVTGLFLESAIAALRDQNWLLKRKCVPPGSFEMFLDSAFENELRPVAFFAQRFGTHTDLELKRWLKVVVNFNRGLAQKLESRTAGFHRDFVRHVVRELTEMVGSAAAAKPNPLALGDWSMANLLYRAFDSLDEVVGLSYQHEYSMKSDPGMRERLYEGAGLGVQTSYFSIIATLERLDFPAGAHLIDLGSGYGRVGLTAGLWRGDLTFTGYEFVGHRVEVANAAAERVGLKDRVRFVCQDLADRDFEIPEADLYYLFDPFCAETYQRVLKRIVEVGRTRSLTVIAKGNAGGWIERAIAGERWQEAHRLEGETIRVFCSQPV